MTISGISSYSNYNLNMDSKMNIPAYQSNVGMSLDSTENVAEEVASGQSSMSLEDIQESMTKQGPGNGPPPPPPSEDAISSLIDSDEDDLWSVEELTDFSDSLVSTIEASFDVEEIMDQYDLNEDGVIDASERIAMKEDDAFQLGPKNEEMKELEETDATEVDAENNSSNYFMERAIQAYDFSNNLQEKFPINIFDSKVV